MKLELLGALVLPRLEPELVIIGPAVSELRRRRRKRQASSCPAVAVDGDAYYSRLVLLPVSGNSPTCSTPKPRLIHGCRRSQPRPVTNPATIWSRRWSVMVVRVVIAILGLLLVLAGAVFIGQGTNVIHG
jgi:hypothetical protein